jgi:rhamnose utilization protein RhaD (predicted bifunctional aldolase and dehydrogenase)
MDKHLSDLIEISRYYGKRKDFVIAGGGNTSFKNDTGIWVKASGTSLGNITPEEFAVLDRQLLKEIYEKKYNADPVSSVIAMWFIPTPPWSTPLPVPTRLKKLY